MTEHVVLVNAKSYDELMMEFAYCQQHWFYNNNNCNNNTQSMLLHYF